MGHDLFQIVGIGGVEDVEEVVVVRTFIIRILVLEVDVELRIIFKGRPQLVDRQLFVVWNVDIVHLIFLFQRLIVIEDLTKEVFVDL